MVARVKRLLQHLFCLPWREKRLFPDKLLGELQELIRKSEQHHSGEIAFAIERSLSMLDLLRGVGARERALRVFSDLRIWDTERNSGVLVYVLVSDRNFEIVADRGIGKAVAPEQWELICREMEQMFRAGKFEEGLTQGISEINSLLCQHFPQQSGDVNELADSPVRL